jgi:hypothetical protein
LIKIYGRAIRCYFGSLLLSSRKTATRTVISLQTNKRQSNDKGTKKIEPQCILLSNNPQQKQQQESNTLPT